MYFSFQARVRAEREFDTGLADNWSGPRLNTAGIFDTWRSEKVCVCVDLCTLTYLSLDLHELLDVSTAFVQGGLGLEEGLVGTVHVLPPEKVMETERGDCQVNHRFQG